MLNSESQKNVEVAIAFLISAVSNSGHNPKPVILHSIRVALKLEAYGQSTDIVIAGVLHDIIEDTEVTQDQIRERFGETVTTLVNANTFDSLIKDPLQQYQELYNRCHNTGKEALMIKTADILDNSDYYQNNMGLWEKATYFLEISKDLIGTEKLWLELKEKCDRTKVSRITPSLRS